MAARLVQTTIFSAIAILQLMSLVAVAVETGRILEDTMTGKKYAEKLAEGIR